MAQLTHVLHLKSKELNAEKEIKAPDATLLKEGEIAINYNYAEPTLYIKDSEGTVREFKSKEVAESLFYTLKGSGSLPNVEGYRTLVELSNTLYTFLTTSTDADSTINKWKELESFLNGIPDSGKTLIDLMSGKVDKTTSVNGHLLTGNITITKGNVGLSNVDNTADSDKPVSTAQATAIADAKKAGTDAQTIINNHTVLKTNPHGVTKTQVGLANVDNTSDASKPVSTAQKAALDLKVDKVTGKGLSTNDYDNSEKGKVASAVQSATIGGVSVTKSGTVLQLPGYPTSLPASDVYAWAKAPTKPNYDYSEISGIIDCGTY